MTLSDYRSLLSMAQRHSRTDADAADLLHEALLAGVKAGRLEFGNPKEKAWLSGVMRNLSASTARSASRRKQRESRWAGEEQTPLQTELDSVPDGETVLSRLSKGSRRVAVLALHGMNQDEICYVLQLKPAAFRQRLTALRSTLQRP